MFTLRDVARHLETWAPPGTAQSYDNVGLQVGHPDKPVASALIGLDMTPALLDEAITLGVDVIITHHPLLFQPVKRLTSDGFASGLALRLAEAGIALYSIHTNLDAAPAGVSFALAEQLGLTEIQFLDTLSDSLYKLVTLAPAALAHDIGEALFEAGAGHAKPSIGTSAHGAEKGVRLEVEVPRWRLSAVVAALQATHPGSYVAYDVYPVVQPYNRAGLGAIGTLPTPEPLSAFLQRIATRLDTPALRYTGQLDRTIKTVAVCGGAGRSLIRKAVAAGADAYVTSDLTYHTFFDVLDTEGTPNMALIDAGHYETERITEALLKEYLTEHFPNVTWHQTKTRTSPITTFIRTP